MAKTPAVGKQACSYNPKAVALAEQLWPIFEDAEASAAFASGGAASSELADDEEMFDIIESFALNCLTQGPFEDITAVFAAIKANTLSDAIMIDWGLNDRLCGYLKQAAASQDA